MVRNLPITMLKFILFALFFWYSNTKPFKMYCSICIIQFKVKCRSDQSLWTNFWTCFMCPTKNFWNHHHNYYSDSYNCCHKQNPIAKETSSCCKITLWHSQQKLHMLSMESSQHPCVVAVNSTEWGENCQTSSMSNIQYWQLWIQMRPVHKFVFHICEGVGDKLGDWGWHICTAAAAESLQSCPTLCSPRDGSPPGSPVPGILQARTLEWVAISFSNAGKWKVKVKSLSRVWPSATPWTAAFQAPPSMGFSRQEYWSGVPLPSPHICTTIYKIDN